MNTANRPGASGSRRTGPPFPIHRLVRGVAACALLAMAGFAGPAAASVLYRCTGAAGEVAYVSSRAGYRHCVEIGSWPATRHHAEGQRLAEAREPPRAVTIAGKPPTPVKANPAVIKVIPLGTEAAPDVRALTPSGPWQPLPLAVLDALGREVLPRLLRIESPTAPAPAGSVGEPAQAHSPLAAAWPPADKPQPPRHGAVYRIVHPNGTVEYTNIAARATGANAKLLFTYLITCYACNVHSDIDWNTVPLHLEDYTGDIRHAAARTGVDVALLRAVIHAESGFNPRALSYKGAQGLMQLMPGTAFELGVGDAFDAAQNIDGGARYLAMLLRDFHGDMRLAAAAYNAGEAAVRKYAGVPPYDETQVYVKRVGILYDRYRKALDVPRSTLAAAGAE